MSSEWLEELDIPEDLKSDPTLQSSPDIGHALSRVIEMRKAQSSSIRLPGEDDESKAKFTDKMSGLGYVRKGSDESADTPPESAEGYEFESLPDDDGRKDYLDVMINARRSAMSEQGVGKRIGEKLLEAEKVLFNNRHEEMVTLATDALPALKEQWGSEFDSKYAKAAKATDYLGGVTGLVMSNGEVVPLETNTRAMNMLSKQSIGEDGQVMKGGSVPTDSVSDLKLQKGVNLSKMSKLKSGDPERQILANENFTLTKKIAAVETGDSSILDMTAEQIAKAMRD